MQRDADAEMMHPQQPASSTAFPRVVVFLGIRIEQKSGELVSTTRSQKHHHHLDVRCDRWVQMQLRVKYHTFRDQRLEWARVSYSRAVIPRCLGAKYPDAIMKRSSPLPGQM
jgi:hypothetical protein